MFFAVQDTPNHNDREDQNTYACQLIVSWPYRAGYLGREDPIEVPSSQEGRLSLMKEIAKSWASPFRDAVYAVPGDTHIQAVNLESWKPVSGAWDNLNGRATLIGDAAHTVCSWPLVKLRSFPRSLLYVLVDDNVPGRSLQPRHNQRRAVRLEPPAGSDRRNSHLRFRGRLFNIRERDDRSDEGCSICQQRSVPRCSQRESRKDHE
jgi:hypothetical protein